MKSFQFIREVVFLFLISSSSAFGQNKSATKNSDCSTLIKQGYTKEFCVYNQQCCKNLHRKIPKYLCSPKAAKKTFLDYRCSYQ